MEEPADASRREATVVAHYRVRCGAWQAVIEAKVYGSILEAAALAPRHMPPDERRRFYLGELDLAVTPAGNHIDWPGHDVQNWLRLFFECCIRPAGWPALWVERLGDKRAGA